mgnify:FL=1|jgi:bacterioferritin (cytochrome b1)
MDELKKLLDSTLNNESKAKDEYGLMIEAIGNSDMPDELKVLATTIVEKIRIDEETHHEMLQMLSDVVNQL